MQDWNRNLRLSPEDYGITDDSSKVGMATGNSRLGRVRGLSRHWAFSGRIPRSRCVRGREGPACHFYHGLETGARCLLEETSFPSTIAILGRGPVGLGSNFSMGGAPAASVSRPPACPVPGAADCLSHSEQSMVRTNGSIASLSAKPE